MPARRRIRAGRARAEARARRRDRRRRPSRWRRAYARRAASARFTAAAIASGRTVPSVRGTTVSEISPARCRANRGRSTELCSIAVVTMCGRARVYRCAYARTAPKSAMFSASVQFFVKTTRSAPAPPKKRLSSPRRAARSPPARAPPRARPARGWRIPLRRTRARRAARSPVFCRPSCVVKVNQRLSPFRGGAAQPFPALSYTGIRYYYMPRLPKG